MSWLRIAGGLVLGLMLQDPLILSQHTHVPMPCANQREVRPRSAALPVLGMPARR